MSTTILGIAVYPDKQKRSDGLHDLTKCDPKTIRCLPEIEPVIMDPDREITYYLVCAIEIGKGKNLKKISVEGEIEKTKGALAENCILESKIPSGDYKDIKGKYRVFWKWESKREGWKNIGTTYRVHLKLIDKNWIGERKETISEFKFDMIFIDPPYKNKEISELKIEDLKIAPQCD